MTGHVRTHVPGSAGALRPGDWWIDEAGGFHSGFEVDSSFDHLFFRHLGHVKIAVDFPKILVSWDIHNVADDALKAIVGRLSSHGSELSVHLRFFFYGWVDEYYPNQNTAIQRINEISQFQSVELIRSTYIEKHNIDNVSAATDLITNGFRLWERTGGNLQRADQDDLCSYLPHVLIFRPSRDDENLVFSHIGSKSTAACVYGSDWVASAYNQKSDATLSQSNMKYDQQVSEAYSHIMATEEPIYDHVRALLHLESHMEPFWVSYERLLTYSLLHDGSPAVICLVNRTQNVSIPLAGGT